MEFNDVISNRRSIRKYDNTKKVIDDDIIKLLECARKCQSAKNRQPWRFMVLREDKKNKIASLMTDYCENNKLEQGNSCKNTAKAIIDADVLILVFKVKDDNWNTGDTLSIGAAIEHICLEATNIRLGSLWIRDTVYVEKQIQKFVGIDANELELISSIAIGYAAENPNERPRKQLNELIIK